MKPEIEISKKLLKRLAHYQFYLKQLEKRYRDYVSIDRLAADMNLSVDEVTEDLESLDNIYTVSKIFEVNRLLRVIEDLIEPKDIKTAALVGAGNFGKALLNYQGFKNLGFEIVAVFDADKNLVGQKLNSLEVLDMDKLEDIVQRLGIKIGIITTPPEPAQGIANRMIESGVQGIWNFTLSLLKVPENIVLQENPLYSNLIQLMNNINKRYERREDSD